MKVFVDRYINQLPAAYSIRHNRYTVVTIEDSAEHPGNKTARSCGHQHWTREGAEKCWTAEFGSIPCPHVATGSPIAKRASTTIGTFGLFCADCTGSRGKK